MDILLADFNAKIDAEDTFKPTIGIESTREISKGNRVREVTFASSKNLIVKSNMLPPHNIQKYSLTFPEGKTQPG
jgi:hypothetical protein